jgi:hypothetical protein
MNKKEKSKKDYNLFLINNMTQLKLSKRALASMDVHKPMSKMFTDALPLLCNCTLNPTGAINLGVAHNDLMKDELLEKVYRKIHICLNLFKCKI